MKKFVTWIAKNILWPILQYVLVEFGKQFAKYLLDLFKQLLAKWMAKEEEEAKTPEEKESVRKKYNERINDIEELKENIDKHIDDVVEKALEKAKEDRDLLIDKQKNSPMLGGGK